MWTCSGPAGGLESERQNGLGIPTIRWPADGPHDHTYLLRAKGEKKHRPTDRGGRRPYGLYFAALVGGQVTTATATSSSG